VLGVAGEDEQKNEKKIKIGKITKKKPYLKLCLFL
jgi:hypothetical protein